MCICTSGIRDMLFKKYLEVACCDTVICGNIPFYYRDLLENRMIEVTMEMSDNEIDLRVDGQNVKFAPDLEFRGVRHSVLLVRSATQTPGTRS